MTVNRRRAQNRRAIHERDGRARLPCAGDGRRGIVGETARGRDRTRGRKCVNCDRTRRSHSRRISGGIPRGNRQVGRTVRIARLHRVGRCVIVASAVVHRRRVAIDRGARDGVRRRESFGDDVAGLGQRCRGVVRGFANQRHRRCHRVDRHRAEIRDRGHVARGIRGGHRYASRAVGVARQHRVGRRVVVAQAMHDRGRLAIDRRNRGGDPKADV